MICWRGSAARIDGMLKDPTMARPSKMERDRHRSDLRADAMSLAISYHKGLGNQYGMNDVMATADEIAHYLNPSQT